MDEDICRNAAVFKRYFFRNGTKINRSALDVASASVLPPAGGGELSYLCLCCSVAAVHPAALKDLSWGESKLNCVASVVEMSLRVESSQLYL